MNDTILKMLSKWEMSASDIAVELDMQNSIKKLSDRLKRMKNKGLIYIVKWKKVKGGWTAVYKKGNKPSAKSPKESSPDDVGLHKQWDGIMAKMIDGNRCVKNLK